MATAYIETTIPSLYVARPSRDVLHLAQQKATWDWWDSGCSGFELVTSSETISEASRGDPKKAKERLELLEPLTRISTPNEATVLADDLIKQGIIPESVSSDALHIAIAAVHGVDYLVTWNFKHIANPFIRERIRKVVTDHGYKMPVMCSPDSLMNYELND